MSLSSATGAGGFDPLALASAAKLTKVGTRPRLGHYLKDFLQRRAFAYTLARYSLQASTAKSSLGAAWHVVVPALQIGVYGVIFGVLLSSMIRLGIAGTKLEIIAARGGEVVASSDSTRTMISTGPKISSR